MSGKLLKSLATPAGLEPATTCLEGGQPNQRFTAFSCHPFTITAPPFAGMQKINVNGKPVEGE